MTLRIEKKLAVSVGMLLSLLIVSIGGLTWAGHAAGRSLAELNLTSASAVAAADALNRSCMSATLQSKAERRRADIERRFRELQSPALVVAGLSEMCRRCGCVVMEITPVSTQQPEQFKGPRYRLVVRTTYRQIAELMDTCTRERLPSRVIEFSVGLDPEEDLAKGLLAELVVECFDPRRVLDGKPEAKKS